MAKQVNKIEYGQKKPLMRASWISEVMSEQRSETNREGSDVVP
jgi:hypothetical protein